MTTVALPLSTGIMAISLSLWSFLIADCKPGLRLLVPGRTFEQQIDNLQMAFQWLKEANLKLNPKKCNLFQREVKYLGHVVSAKGVSPDPEKVEAIQAWPRSMSITDVKSFLGLASYYRRFIAGFANIAAPLHECTKKTTTFAWSTEAQAAFTKLKLLSLKHLCWLTLTPPTLSS